MSKLVLNCLWGISLICISCIDHVLAQESTTVERFCYLASQSPREDTEAEEAALWMSGDFVAPESLYMEISDALRRLRTQFSSQLPIVNEIHFTPRFADELLCTSPKLAGSHGSPYVDSLIACLHGELVDTLGPPRIRFSGHFRIDSVAALYANSGGGQDVAFPGRMQPTPNVYPWRSTDGRLTLLFMDTKEFDRRGREFWYFRVGGNTIEFVGHCYENEFLDRQIWWGEARIAYEKFGGDEDDRAGRLHLN